MDQQIVRIAQIEIDPGQLQSYLDFLKEEIETSVWIEPGVIMLHATSRKDAPHLVQLLEVYASRAAYEAHIASPHFLKYKSGTMAMVRSLELIEVDPILLAAKPA